jgi:hypothetical protein
MNLPTADSSNATPPNRSLSRSPSRSRLLMLVAVIMVAVPLIVIGWLTNMVDEETGLVTCQGSIRVNGQALTSGQIVTRRDNATSDEASSIGTIDALGRFQLTTGGQPGAPVGHHRVTVVPDGETGGVEIPQDYQSLEDSMLAIDVQPESRFNIFTLNITAED